MIQIQRQQQETIDPAAPPYLAGRRVPEIMGRVTVFRHLSSRLAARVHDLLDGLDKQLFDTAQLQLLAHAVGQDMGRTISVCQKEQRWLRTMNVLSPIEMRQAYGGLVKLTSELQMNLEGYTSMLRQTNPEIGIVSPKSQPLDVRLWERALDDPDAGRRASGEIPAVRKKTGIPLPGAKGRARRESQQRYEDLRKKLITHYQEITHTAEYCKAVLASSGLNQRVEIAQAIGRLVPLIDWLVESLQEFQTDYLRARRADNS